MGAVIKAVNRAYDRIETRPFWKVRLIAIVLVFATGLITAGMFLLIVFGGSLGDAIVARTDLGGNFKLIWDIARWPIAFAAVLLFFAFVYYLAPNIEQRLALALTGLAGRRADVARALGAVRPLHELLGLVRAGRTARSPARSCCCSG